jgi:hypothetical protein
MLGKIIEILGHLHQSASYVSETVQQRVGQLLGELRHDAEIAAAPAAPASPPPAAPAVTPVPPGEHEPGAGAGQDAGPASGS